MKLKVTHLSQYLPYKIKAKFQYNNDCRCRVYVIGTVSVVYSNATICCFDTVNAYPERFKLLLHPKSIITDEWLSELNLDLSDKFVLKDFADNHIGYWSLSYNHLEILFQYHIDVFDLIPKKLAVAI